MQHLTRIQNSGIFQHNENTNSVPHEQEDVDQDQKDKVGDQDEVELVRERWWSDFTMGKILVMMMVMMMHEMARVEGEQSSSEAPAVVQPRLSYLVYALGEVLCNAWSMQCSWYAILLVCPVCYPPYIILGHHTVSGSGPAKTFMLSGWSG